MKTKNTLIAFSALFLLTIALLPAALAASSPFSSLKTILDGAFEILLGIFRLDFLQDNYVAFMRMMIWIITFAIFHAVMQFLMKTSLTNLATSPGGNRLPLIISFCLATITSVFMPASVLMAIGIQYSAIWSAIIMGAVFAAMLYLCYTQFPPKGQTATALHHALRLGLLLVCWMLLFNFTAAVEEGNLTQSTASYTPFVNPVLEFLWDILGAVIGILIIYEIIKLLGFIGAGGAGQFSGNSRKEDKLEKDEQKDLNRINADENRESSAADRAMRFGKELHELILSLIKYLLEIKEELLAGKMTAKIFISRIGKITGKLGEAVRLLQSQQSAEEWAYKIVSDEMSIVDNLNQMLDQHNKLVTNLRAELSHMPDTNPYKSVLSEGTKKLESMVGAFSNQVKQLKDGCIQKSREMYIALSPAHQLTEDIKNATSSLKDLEPSHTEKLVPALDKVLSYLEAALKKLQHGNEFLSVFYTMNRDQKNQMNSGLNKLAKDIEIEHNYLERQFKTASQQPQPAKP